MGKKTKKKRHIIESKIISKSAKETQEIGEVFAGKIIQNAKIKTQKDKATLFALSGELGSGKTTFLQGFAKGLGIKKRIISPTFILLRTYDIEKRKKDKVHSTFIHIDLYRLEGKVEGQLRDLGFEDFLNDPENIIAVEWAEKAKNIMPDDAIWINFKYDSEFSRKIDTTGL